MAVRVVLMSVTAVADGDRHDAAAEDSDADDQRSHAEAVSNHHHAASRRGRRPSPWRWRNTLLPAAADNERYGS